MDDNKRNYEIFSVLLNESEEGISFAVASPKLQKKLAAWARAGQVGTFDYLDLPEEDRNYKFTNIQPLFILHPDLTSFLLFNAQEALITREDYLQLNFSRDMLIRTHKNIIFFVTKNVYENIVRIAHDINSSTKLKVFFEDEESYSKDDAKSAKDGETAGSGHAAKIAIGTESNGAKSDGGSAAEMVERELDGDVPGGTMEKLREDLLHGKLTVVFGRYPQGENGEVEPLLWRVLRVKGSMVLLITEKLIDAVAYNIVDRSVTWETCTLRKWMNEDFIWEAFDEEEASHITEVHVKNSNNKKNDTDGGNDTRDQVFALSIEEANGYFQNDRDRVAEVTPYAIRRGSYYTQKKLLPSDSVPYKMGWWWLRSPGLYSSDAACVFTGGIVSADGHGVSSYGASARPALWIHLQSEIC